MNSFSSIFLFSLLVLCTYAADPCAFSATARPRTSADGSWVSNGKQYQVYDILVTNTGTCELSRVVAYFAYPPTATLESAFNYDSSSGEITLGSALASGATFSGAGFILSGTGSPTLARPRAFCPSTCTSSSTIAPTVSATPVDACNNQCPSNKICVALETSVPACHYRLCSDLPDCSAPNQVCINNGGVARCINHTVSPTPSPVPTTQTPCQLLSSISASVVKRAGSDFVRNGVNNAIYDLTFSATAAVRIATLKVNIVPVLPGAVVESWNLREVAGYLYQYDVDTYGALDKQGATYKGAGFVLSGDSAPLFSVVNFTCSA